MGYWLAHPNFVTQIYWELNLCNSLTETNGGGEDVSKIIMHFFKIHNCATQSDVVKAAMRSEMQSVDSKAVRWSYFGNV